ELVYAAGVAAAVTAQRSPAGTYIPDPVYCNVGRRHAGLNIYHEYEIVADLAGGLPATLPMEGDFYHAKLGPLLDKYMMRNPRISAADQHRCFRALSDAICSGLAGLLQIAGLHGGGSPVMENIATLGFYDLETRKNIAKHLAGIPLD
ncbi:MAG: aromatic ring hydroxylase, partial [Desulfobacterales bacterium]|nr:aromatic ring hydroxylase [Desulfobacterales bacterium]